ncbi:MAG: hypothetical protein AAGB00_04255 [Planctomycetota bacterium]
MYDFAAGRTFTALAVCVASFVAPTIVIGLLCSVATVWWVVRPPRETHGILKP